MISIVQPSEDDLAALVKPYLALQAENTSLAFVIGIASPDPDVSAIYTFGGVQRQDNGPLALTEDTPFVLASVSKTFTATAYAHFLETQGPADATLGDFPELEIGEQFADITLTSLVNYSSGLPQDNGPPHDEPRLMPQPYTIPGMLGFLNYTQMKPASQLAYRYSNLGFGLMGAVLPAYADQDASYEEIVIDLIFEPLELSAQFFDEVRLDTLPQGYYFSGQSYQSAAAPGWPQFPAYHGAGGIVASPADMQVWLQFNMGLLPDCPLNDLLGVLQSPSTTATTGWGDQLGLGWFLGSVDNTPFSTVWKDGDLPGFSSYIAFLPSPAPGTTPAPAGVFVLSNTDGMTAMDGSNTEICCALANDVLYLMQGLTPPVDKSAYPRSKGR